MIDQGKKNVIGILVNAVDYESTVDQISAAAHEGKSFPISCASVHALMEGSMHAEHRYRMNRLAMVVPDGMPVRWALNILHGTKLPDRVRGVTLALKVLARAEAEGLGVYFYGNSPDVLGLVAHNVLQSFPGIRICGMEPSKFRRLDANEKSQVVQSIRDSGAAIVFTGLGAPLQDIWAYEYAELQMPILCVGGFLNIMAGRATEAPMWLQRWGLEWAYRLFREPRRLWRRYLLLNPVYMWRVAMQKIGRSFESEGRLPPAEMSCG